MISDLSFRAHETLCDRGLRCEKRARDLSGAEAARSFKCERDLMLNWKLRMTTHQDQRQLIVHLAVRRRSEEHTSELQSLAYLVCRLLLEKKKKTKKTKAT